MDALALPALFADYVATPEFMSAITRQHHHLRQWHCNDYHWTNHRLTSGTVCAQWRKPDFAD